VSDAFKTILNRLADGAVLTEAEAEAFFGACLRGEATPAQVAAAVTAMRMCGEDPGEIAAFARAMRKAALALKHSFEVVDTCGTGGDGQHTLNISTAAAFVAAGAGAKVAKHGSRALSSRSGSSDVLGVLGVNVEATPEQSLAALAEANICFLFAPAYHGAMRHVTPVRAELGFRTVFNLLGPLSNPANATRQVMGVYDPSRLETMAEVLGRLGAVRAWAVHGQGLDEITTTGSTQVVEWRDGGLHRFEVTPEAAEVPRAALADLRGGDPEENASALRDLLQGRKGPYRDITLLNAAAVLVVADLAPDLVEGARLAAQSIDEGNAQMSLERLVKLTAPVSAA
jgi:anthranilate phosphoribosyltransferase